MNTPFTHLRRGPRAVAAVLLLLTCLLAPAARAQTGAGALPFQWAQLIGGAQADFGNEVVIDASGNHYTVGLFTGVAAFGPTLLTSRGNTDVALAKFTSTGALLWVQQLGGVGGDFSSSLALDAAGNVLVAGGFNSVATFGPGTSLSSAGQIDVFVAKFSPAGTLLWAQRGGGQGNDQLVSLTVDASGAVLAAGSYGAGAATFGPFSVTGSSNLLVAPLLVKLSSSGSWQWALGGVSGNTSMGRDVAVDAAGNAYLIGTYRSPLTLGPLQFSQNYNGDHTFVARVSAAGTWEWGQEIISSNGTSLGWSLTLDEAGGVYCTGEFTGSISAGGTVLTSTGPSSSDLFVAKLSSSGQWQWARRAGGSSADAGYGVRWSAATNALYLTGYFTGTASFGPLTLNSPDPAAGDLLVGCLDAAGSWQWLQQGGGPGLDYGLNLDVDAAGNVYVIGSTLSTSLTLGGTVLSNSGNRDALLARLGNLTLKTQSPAAAPALVAYPNPATGRATLVLGSAVRGAAQVLLQDALGRTVRRQTVATGQASTELDLRGLPAGVYLLRLTPAGSGAIGRLVVR